MCKQSNKKNEKGNFEKNSNKKIQNKNVYEK